MLGSQDILFIVLAFCALWFTAFLCWLIYQAASLLRHVHGLVDEIKERVASLEDAVTSMRRKFEGNITMVSSIAEGVRKIIDAMRSRDQE
jgi:predicted PurR-regulated permease PerM